MRKLHILGVTGLAVMTLALDALAQRGGAARSGMRGAVVGGMVGGSEGAATGAKVGVVTGATRAALDGENRARTQYQTSAEYQNAPRSNFNEAPPEVLVTSASAEPAIKGGEAVIRKDGKPVVGITFPADWKQKSGDRYVAAVSADGQAWAVIATLDGIADKQGGIAKVKQGLEKYLQDIKYDDPTETKGGALLVTGTGKAKKAGVEVVFAAGVFNSGKGQLAGAAFIADAKIEDHYKETVKHMCQTIRLADDFAK